jgi:hypothetical protein
LNQEQAAFFPHIGSQRKDGDPAYPLHCGSEFAEADNAYKLTA